MDLSICIPQHGNPIGLWLTVHSCEVALAGSGLTYEYCVCANGECTDRASLDRQIKALRDAKLLGSFVDVPEVLSPPAARQRATAGAKGEILFFLDNHCVVERDFFTRALADFDEYNVDLLFSAFRRFSKGPTHYHYVLSGKDYGEIVTTPFRSTPYQIVCASHSGFAVRRDTWDSTGGYGPEKLFKGWGAEELYLTMKLALLDKTSWIDPNLIHYHYSGSRRSRAEEESEYRRNMMVTAFVLGGERRLNELYEAYRKGNVNVYKSNWEAISDQVDIAAGKKGKLERLYDDAYESGKEHASWLTSVRTRSLETQLEKFRQDEVPF